jgi:hypothetical protein
LALSTACLELPPHQTSRSPVAKTAALRAECDRFAQPGEQFPEPGLRLLVGAGNAGLGIDDQRQLAREVVDHRNFFGKQQHDVGNSEVVRFLGARQPGFDIADGVVAEAADQATAEARQAGGRSGTKALHVLADEVERVGVVFAFGDAIAVQHQHLMRIDHDPRRAGQADDRVTAKALAALHRFEQVGVGAVGQLQVDRQRRVEIGEGFERHRDAVVAFGGQAIEIGFGHRNSTRMCALPMHTRGGTATRQPTGASVASTRPPPGRRASRAVRSGAAHA